MANTEVKAGRDPLSAGTGSSAHLTAIEYKLLVEHSPVLIWRADLNKKCDYFNKVWLDFTGRSLEQELGDGWAESVHPDDLDRCFNIYVTNFDARQPFEMEYRLKRHDGVYRWIFDRGVPYTGDNGEFLGYIGSCVDVTERREGEQAKLDIAAEQAALAAVRESEARERFLAHVSEVMGAHLEYGNALNALVDLIVPALADVCFFLEIGDDDSVRPLAWKHVDAGRNEWLGQRIKSGVVKSTKSAVARAFRQGVPEFVPEVTEEWITGVATSPEHERFLRDQGLRSVMRIPIRDGDRLLGVLSLARSTDDRPYTDGDLNLAVSIGDRLTSALRNARLYSELQQAMRARDEVTSVVSHDLRNPVHAVLMASSLLLDTGDALDPATRRKNLAVIHRSAESMSRLLQDLLDVARAEAGTFAVEAAPTDVGSILNTTLEEFRLQSADRGIELSSDISPTLPPVPADAARVAQVLSNLFANALKFTPKGGMVRLSAAQVGSEIVVSVADSGVGIAPENVGQVFNRFWQAKRGSRGGAGLGLAIAKSIVEAHGGRIWVESTEGEGTTFQFTLPTSAEPAKVALV
jgi:PAS domain S-box-containing protein